MAGALGARQQQLELGLLEEGARDGRVGPGREGAITRAARGRGRRTKKGRSWMRSYPSRLEGGLEGSSVAAWLARQVGQRRGLARRIRRAATGWRASALLQGKERGGWVQTEKGRSKRSQSGEAGRDAAALARAFKSRRRLRFPRGPGLDWQQYFDFLLAVLLCGWRMQPRQAAKAKGMQQKRRCGTYRQALLPANDCEARPILK